MPHVHARMLARIRRKKRGQVYTNKDFMDLGNRQAVGQALSRLVKSGELRRVARGLYYYPHYSRIFGWGTFPAQNVLLDALTRQRGLRIAPSGAAAANLLGLSTQVPARPALVTDGRTQTIRVGPCSFEFTHVSPKKLPYDSPIAALVIQAFRWLGPNSVDERAIDWLCRTLPPHARKELLKHAHYGEDWIAERIHQIAAGGRSASGRPAPR